VKLKKNLEGLFSVLEGLFSVLEGLFSEKENTFIVHEIMHLADHIPEMGPLHGWWTYAGERSMSFVKSFVPIGGKSFDKTAMMQYNAAESDITAKAFLDNFYEDDKEETNALLSMSECGKYLEYDNNRFAIFQKINSKQEQEEEFSDLEKDYLLDCLLGEIHKVCHDDIDALTKSTLFQLHYAYTWLEEHYQLKRQHKIESFKDLIYAVRENNRNDFFDVYFDSNLILKGKDEKVRILLLSNRQTALQIYNFLEFRTSNAVSYKKALIYGLHFTARGIEFTEKFNFKKVDRYGVQNPDVTMNKSINHLNRFENWSNQYSSWCRYRTSAIEYSDNDSNSSIVKYGQLNYFFRFQCKNDKLLHGLPIANLVPRNFQTISQTVDGEKIFLGVDKIPCTPAFHYE
jgi:hypothetical protein